MNHDLNVSIFKSTSQKIMSRQRKKTHAMRLPPIKLSSMTLLRYCCLHSFKLSILLFLEGGNSGFSANKNCST